MGTEIENAIGINRNRDRGHVDNLLAAGGFGAATPNPAPRHDGVSMAKPAGVKGSQRFDPEDLGPRPIAEVTALKPVRALQEKTFGKKLKRSPVAPPPRLCWLRLEQLVIDDTYQRDVSEQGMRLIRRMVEDWDWGRFKPLSVAAAEDGLFEIVDGQHTAIAAATHGSIEMLPCLVLPLATVADRAKAFVGVNSERTALRSYALFRGRLVAGQPLALAVQGAVEDSGCRLIENVSAQVSYEPGAVACISTMLAVAKGGGRDGLARLLRICVAAGVGPIPAALLRALDEVVRGQGPEADAETLDSRLVTVITERTLDRLHAQADALASDGLNRRLGLVRVISEALEA